MRNRIIILLLTILSSSLNLAQTSRIELLSLSVPGIGSWDFNVYLPPGYDQSTERLPVLYLFRGAVDEWLDRTEDGSRAGRNIQDITDALIAQGKIRDVILIMPGFTAMAGPATEADYSFILNTLIPFVDQHYRTMPSRWFRGVDGFSLGGLHMVNLIWKNPERFSSAGMYDGTLSMFNMNLMISAGEPFFARMRAIQFLLHSAAVQPSNLSNNRQFDNLLSNFGIHNAFDSLIFSSTSQHNWWNADEHMIRSLPLHWTKFQNPVRNVSLQWSSILPSKVRDTVNILWSVGGTSDSLKTLIEYSRDAGITWQTILYSTTRDSIYNWQTTSVADGTRYLLRIQVFSDTSYGMIQSPHPFTVDNPGNWAPDIILLSPQKNEKVSGKYSVQWSANDPEGDPIQTSIFVSMDRGVTWQMIASGLPHAGVYEWNSNLTANSSSVQLKIRCSDGTATSEMVSQPFEVFNQRETISSILHISGHADARVKVNIVDRSQWTGHTYRIFFDDTSSAQKCFSLFDVSRNAFIFQNIHFAGDGSEGPQFDGLRLSIYDQQDPMNNPDSTTWIKGSSTLFSQVATPNLFFGSDVVKGVAYPSDYEIRITSNIVDTSSSFMESTTTPLYYSVWNITENHQVKVIVSELDSDGKLDLFDDIFILENDRSGKPYITWEIFFSGDSKTILPAAGDIFRIKTTKPLRSNDIYEFNGSSSAVSVSNSNILRHMELDQNFPNPFNPVTIISYYLPGSQTGVAQSDIVHLAVFDISGRKIITLVNEFQEPGRHTVAWNASALSSGIYFYQLSAGGRTTAKKAIFVK
jgi:hypothetical protein